MKKPEITGKSKRQLRKTEASVSVGQWWKRALEEKEPGPEGHERHEGLRDKTYNVMLIFS